MAALIKIKLETHPAAYFALGWCSEVLGCVVGGSVSSTRGSYYLYMQVYCFELSFTAAPGVGTIDALYEAGWDDATVSWDADTGGPGMAAFDREAESAVEAIASAIRQGRSAGVVVTGSAKTW